MFEILALVTLILAARKGTPRRRRRYIRGNVDEQLALSTLGGKVVISQIFDSVVNERTLVSSIVANWSLRSFTPATDDGPIMVGVAHSDYSSAEIEAWIENTGGWDEGNKVQQEVAQRKIRIVGTFPGFVTAETQSSVLNDGKAIKTKLNWVILQAQTLQVWAYNLGSSALATTSPIVSCEGHANLWPL